MHRPLTPLFCGPSPSAEDLENWDPQRELEVPSGVPRAPARPASRQGRRTVQRALGLENKGTSSLEQSLPSVHMVERAWPGGRSPSFSLLCFLTCTEWITGLRKEHTGLLPRLRMTVGE